MTGICTNCGKRFSVPSYRGSKLKDYRSRCCDAPMKAPPRKPPGLPYALWNGDYEEREAIRKAWNAGEVIEYFYPSDYSMLDYCTRQVLQHGGISTPTPTGVVLSIRKTTA